MSFRPFIFVDSQCISGRPADELGTAKTRGANLADKHGVSEFFVASTTARGYITGRGMKKFVRKDGSWIQIKKAS